MKSFTLLLLSIALTTASYSQLKVGLTVGGHQSEILEDNNIPNWNEIKKNYSKRTGMHFGLLADLPITQSGNITFQPGVLFYHKGRTFSQTFDTTAHDTLQIKSNEFLNYIDVPVNIVGKLPIGKNVRFVFGAGPYLSFYFDGYLKTEIYGKNGSYYVDENLDPSVGKGPGRYSTLDYGANALAGFEFGRVSLVARYSRGFKDIFEPASYEGTFRNQTLGVSLGVFLGKPVKRAEKDRDEDGIADAKDKCPDLKGSALLEGCPDQDSDGIADKDDDCPGSWGPAANKGCPYQDKDGDGLLDKDDKCPTVAGTKENNGCPEEDSDKDGIVNKDDKCPTVAGDKRYSGCPVPDSDGDGLNDELDKCPGAKGSKENGGCPEIQKEIVEKVTYAAKSIQFEFTKSTVSPASFKTLNDIADILKQNPELKLTIEGHTSNSGIYEVNMKLSKERAEKVKEYLVSKGISPSRLTAIGYGPTRPVTDGKTEAEKAKNRRVELKLSNQ